MSSNRWRTALRRFVTVVAGATTLTMVGASAALAFGSPGTPPGTGDQTITWTGQGADGGVLNTTDCSATSEGGGQPYLLWVLTTDGNTGNITLDNTTPTLTLGGTGSGSYQYSTAPGNTVKFVTPYYNPNGLTASVLMHVLNVGASEWGLKISHGCAPSVPPAKALTISKTAAGTYDTTYKWGITKGVDHNQFKTAESATANYTVNVTHDGGTNSNYQVSGVVTVNNPNSVPVGFASLTDTLSGGSPQDISGGATQLQPGPNTFPYSFSLNQPPSGALDDAATVTWPTQPVQDTSGLTGGTATATASTGAFTQDKVTDASVTISDPAAPDSVLPATVNVGDFPAGQPGMDFPYSVTYTDPAGTCTSHTNTATINETGQTADQTVQVCVGKNLSVTKTATPSFDRTYTWGITKSVNPAKVSQVGGTATFHYTVGVTHDNGTDGNWQVKGKITITNPNDWEPVTVNITDAIGNGGTCTVGKGSPGDVDPASAVIPASGSVDFPYTCTYGSAPDPSSFTNTATASWDAGKAFTPDGSAHGTATGDFTGLAPSNIIDGSVNVTDTLGGTLGKVSYTDPSPTNYTYDNTVSVPQFNCTKVDNTATFTTDSGKTGSASQTAYACGPAKTGALTMGYWQNKNGQAQITSGTSTAGVCDSGTFLRSYASFQDLSATATCSQVATYVSGVIKAANASGASMNAMLKAQMLATALDVYFNPSIGSFNMDLTKVYTAGGTYVNVSGAFGGATSMTVNAMLSSAASQSNSGGSVWYGQVKATQELAKDAFDAINNQWAFGA